MQEKLIVKKVLKTDISFYEIIKLGKYIAARKDEVGSRTTRPPSNAQDNSHHGRSDASAVLSICPNLNFFPPCVVSFAVDTSTDCAE